MTEESKPESNASMSGDGWRVEVRAKNKPIVGRDGRVIGTEWEPLPTIEATTIEGVDSAGRYARGAGASTQDLYRRMTDTHSFYGAVALATSWYAQNEHLQWFTDLRLVEYKIAVTHTRTHVGYVELNDAIELAVKSGLAKRAALSERGSQS